MTNASATATDRSLTSIVATNDVDSSALLQPAAVTADLPSGVSASGTVSFDQQPLPTSAHVVVPRLDGGLVNAALSDELGGSGDSLEADSLLGLDAVLAHAIRSPVVQTACRNKSVSADWSPLPLGEVAALRYAVGRPGIAKRVNLAMPETYWIFPILPILVQLRRPAEGRPITTSPRATSTPNWPQNSP